MNIQEPSANSQTRLESWKEIGAYLQRDATTARRWEKEEGLPVHRHTHKSRSSVYAYPSEIDVWRASRKVVPEPAPARPLWKIPALALTMVLCLIMVGNGIRPQVASAQNQPNTPRQVWIAGSGQRPLNTGLSADGRYIAFTDATTGDLGIHDLTTGATRSLTNSGGWEASGAYANSAVISADNRLVAYSWLMPKEQRTEVHILSINGGARRTVLRLDGVQERIEPVGWTPDGKRLLAVHFLADRSKQMAMLSTEDGSIRVIKSVDWRQDPHPRLSPDGRYIAYHASVEGAFTNRDIFILAVDGSGEALAAGGSSDDSEPFWAPDGSRIFFASNRTGNQSLWSVPIKEGKPAGPAELAKSDVDLPLGIARNGTLYSVKPSVGKSNIYSAELDTEGKVSKAPALAVERYIDSNNGPSLSPDGKYLAYYSLRPQRSLVIQTLQTGEERVVPADVPLAMNLGYGPMWFPDGRSVLVGSAAQRPQPGGYRVDLESGKAEMVFAIQTPIETYMLSPDGRSLFITEVIPGNAVTFNLTRLIRYDLDTRRRTELKSGEAIISPVVSPDGKQVAYMVNAATSRYLAVMPTAGGESREIYRDPESAIVINSFVWTPDQHYVLFVRGGIAEGSPNILWRVPAGGGPATRLGSLLPGNLKSPQLRSDGRRIFFSDSENSPSEVWASGSVPPKTSTK